MSLRAVRYGVTRYAKVQTPFNGSLSNQTKELPKRIDADTRSETERRSDSRNWLTSTATVLLCSVRRGKDGVDKSISVPVSTAL
jgi:hypothetical protein